MSRSFAIQCRSPFSSGNTCKQWRYAVGALRQAEQDSAEGGNILQEDTAVAVDKRPVARAEEVEPGRAAVDRHTQGDDGPC